MTLFFSALGTIVGLGLFVVLGRRLIDPGPSPSTTALDRIVFWADPVDRNQS